MNIESEVAAFREDLDGLAAFDVDVIAYDTTELVDEIITAPSHEAAAVCIREFIDARPEAVNYARAVVVGALSAVGLHVMLIAPMDSLDGDGGLLRRLKRLAYAVRALGISATIGDA